MGHYEIFDQTNQYTIFFVHNPSTITIRSSLLIILICMGNPFLFSKPMGCKIVRQHKSKLLMSNSSIDNTTIFLSVDSRVVSGKCDQSVINCGLPTMEIHVHLIATIDKLYLNTV